jgi:hypothetical protein
MKINHYNEMQVGGSYKITWPNYDDYEEGLTPDTSKVTILARYPNSFLIVDLQHNVEMEIKFNVLVDCELEQI